MRKERKILRFVPQKLRKSFANGNPITNVYNAVFEFIWLCGFHLHPLRLAYSVNRFWRDIYSAKTLVSYTGFKILNDNIHIVRLLENEYYHVFK